MEIKTHIEKDKNKLPKHIIEFLHDGNKATFINGGQDSIRYEDFDIGMLKCGSIYWMSHVDNENKLYTIRHWEQIRMRNKKSKCKILYTNVCL